MEICEHEFTQQALSQDQSMIGALPCRSYTVGRREVKEGDKGRRGRERVQARKRNEQGHLPTKNILTAQPTPPEIWRGGGGNLTPPNEFHGWNPLHLK